MSASLVGSEMCIRDRSVAGASAAWRLRGTRRECSRISTRSFGRKSSGRPVSYTHLTLPTICSV
eukprot:2744381-Alexandrium_andersonii.AAC.1